ncbi:MAG: histidine kinase dimerization/phospho-acceptor domain-containing protein, partial [Nitrososphaeraceae archaeon]
PIQPILGLSDVLLQSNTTFVSIQNDRIRQKEIIEIIARNARRLQRLTEDILDVTRIEGRTLNLNMESFVLSKIVDEMVKDYTVESRNNRTNITFYLFTSKEVEPISVLADKNRI